MALLWIEGFEGFGTTIGDPSYPPGVIDRKYPVANRGNYMDVQTGRNGRSLEIHVSDDYIQSPHLTTNATCILGMAIKLPVPSSTSAIFHLYEGANLGINLRVTPAGYIECRRGTTVLGTSIIGITFNNWFYIGLKVLTNNSIGTVDVKVNGVSYLALTSQDTQPGSNAYHTAFRVGMIGASGSSTVYDDLYFLDGSGSVNNDFLGNRQVIALDPDSDGDLSDWAPSAGNNYENVDDGGLVDNNATYNETSTDAHQDLYTFEDLSSDITSVDGVQINTVLRVTTGSMDISHTIKTGTTTSQGTPETVTTTVFVTVVRVEEEDPDTLSAWTPSGVNAAQFGIKANT